MIRINPMALAVLAACAVSILSAQPVTVVNHFRTDTTGRGLQGMQLVGSEEHRVVINYYEPAPEQEIDRLGQVLGSALIFYIDQSVSVRNGKIELRKSRKDMVRDMNDIVKQAVKHYRFKEVESFKGFSEEVSRKIDELSKLDFNSSDAAKKPQPGTTRAQQEFFFVQNHLNELKRKVNAEVGNFGRTNLMVWSSSETALVDDATRDSLLRSLYFDQEKTLRPFFYENGMAELSLFNVKDQSSLELGAKPDAKPADEFTSRVLAMLERNESKLDAMQAQIDQLRADQLRQWQQMQESRNEQMQAQINDLRGMVVDLMRMTTAGVATSDREILISSPNSGSTVFNIPSQINLYFSKGSTQLSANSVFALNEVIDILARNPGLQLMITGSADKSGDPVRNLMLSQERASAVKKFLRKSGLGEDRFITKYLGDSNSDMESAGDRKVVLEFIR